MNMDSDCKKVLKVAWIFENLLWWNGGIKYLLEVSSRLRYNCDLDIYTTRVSAENKAKFNDAGVQVKEFSNTSVNSKRYWLLFPFYVLSNTVKLRKQLESYDVVISTNPTDCLIAAMLENKKISVMYDFNFWLHSADYIKGVHPLLRFFVSTIRPVARIVDRWAVRKADAIVTICNYTAKMMKKEYGRLPLILHEGVDPDLFISKHNMELERVYSGRTVIIHLASYLGPTKGTKYAIKALPEIAKRVPDVLLLILNASNDVAARKQLLNLAHELGVEANIMFSPPVSDNELPYYYSLAQVVIQPSLDENTHLPVEEGAACETPSVTFKGTLDGEDIIDGITGFEVPREDVGSLADAVVRLIRDRELNIKLGENGRQHIINNFSWQKNAEQMWALINAVVYGKHQLS